MPISLAHHFDPRHAAQLLSPQAKPHTLIQHPHHVPKPIHASLKNLPIPILPLTPIPRQRHPRRYPPLPLSTPKHPQIPPTTSTRYAVLAQVPPPRVQQCAEDAVLEGAVVGGVVEELTGIVDAFGVPVARWRKAEGEPELGDDCVARGAAGVGDGAEGEEGEMTVGGADAAG